MIEDKGLYNINLISTGNGTVTADKEYAAPGETVNLTISPDPGYDMKNYSITKQNETAAEPEVGLTALSGSAQGSELNNQEGNIFGYKAAVKDTVFSWVASGDGDQFIIFQGRFRRAHDGI
jgi:hypothetical protein